ncbi:hypothetical protein BJY01DRAFT_201600 [Aspergillus pseudoustus]|uniref:Uncharacterized protein n=1 Tax=Aspergillus pseudoustus TaxID=1810923 RepID=A0ABR4L089_9EURO
MALSDGKPPVRKARRFICLDIYFFRFLPISISNIWICLCQPTVLCKKLYRIWVHILLLFNNYKPRHMKIATK